MSYRGLDTVELRPANWQCRGRVWVFGDNINTDLMLPGWARGTILEKVQYCMRANRPGWVDQVQPGDIIIGGKNYGTGSNRPAPLVLKLLGLDCLVAESVFHLFFRNAVNFAFPVMSCPGVTQAFTEGDIAEVDFNTGEVTNTSTGTKLQGTILPRFIREVMEAGGTIPALRRDEYLGR